MNPLRDPQRAVGKTIAAIKEYGFCAEIIFTDDTKLQIEPDGTVDADGVLELAQPELIFQDDIAAD